MNLDSQLIYESYLKSKNPFILEGGIKDLYNQDLICLEEILAEGMLGDTLSKIGTKLGGAAKSVGTFFKDKLMKGILDILISKLSKEEKDKLSSGLKELEDPKVLQQKAKEGQDLLKQQNESRISNKDFLRSLLFTESNLAEYFTSTILLEAKKRGKPAKISPLSKKTTQMAQDISELLQKIYKNESQRKAAYRRFNAQLLKKLGITDIQMVENKPQNLTQAARTNKAKTAASGAAGSAAASGGSAGSAGSVEGGSAREAEGGKTGSGAAPEGQAPSGGGEGQAPSGGGEGQAPSGGGEGAAPAGGAPEEKEGFLKKAYNWVKQNPNLTAGGVIALVAALTVVTGGAILPIAAKALMGAGITGGIEAGKQKIQTGQVDWNKVKSSALKGAAGGAVLGGLGQLAGGVASSLGGGDADTTVDTDYDEDSYSGGGADFDSKTDTMNKYGGADKEFVDSQEPPQADVDTSVSEDEFKQYNKTSYNPKSIEDQTKKFGMEQLKQKYNGKIPASKYNELAAKISKLVRTKKGLTPESALAQIDPTLFGESYTVQYLKYF